MRLLCTGAGNWKARRTFYDHVDLEAVLDQWEALNSLQWS